MSIPKGNNPPAKFPDPLVNKAWHVEYELVFNHFCSVAESMGYKPTIRGFCDFLEISAGKRHKWSLGQWPSAEDLEKLHDRLGFSYRWLITGEGDPFEEDGSLPEEGARVHALEARLQELEQENAGLKAKLTSSEVGELRGRLADLESTVRQLQTRLLIDGVGDKNAATGIDKAAGGQG